MLSFSRSETFEWIQHGGTKSEQRRSGELLPLSPDPFKRPGWPQRCSRCRSPSASCWSQIAAGRRTAGKREGGSPLYKRAPGHPVDFRSRVAMVEPLAPFQIETISLSPLIPPNTHLLLLLPPFPPQTPAWSFSVRANTLHPA